VESPTLQFAYAQLGQENSFGWTVMEPAYERQMKKLVPLRKKGMAHVETMGETGQRFKAAFRETPAQAQIMLKDSFGNTDIQDRTVWYQTRFYRGNLHFHGNLPFLRDLTVYVDSLEQPFLRTPTTSHDVEQRMPAVLDGYHWSTSPGSADPGAGGFFLVDGRRLTMSGEPKVKESRRNLEVEVSLEAGGTLHVAFEERQLRAWLTGRSGELTLSFEWDVKLAALESVQPKLATYRSDGQ